MKDRFDKPALAICFASVAICDLNFSCLAAFFPLAAADRGVSSVLVGAIFSANPIANVVFTPLVPRLLARFNITKVMWVALLVQGIATALFALGDVLPFTATCLVLRVVQGALAATAECAGTSLVMRSVPESHIPHSVGWLEAARGVGVALGPPVGGFVYQLGGFSAPFLMNAALLCALGVAGAIVLPRRAERHRSASAAADDAPSARALLRLPPFVAAMLLNLFAAAALSFLDPTVQPFMHKTFGLNEAQVGLFFSVAVFAFIAGSLVGGHLTAKLGAALQIVLGFASMAVGYALLGPAPPLQPLLPQSLATTSVGLVFLGAGVSQGLVPTTALMMSAARCRGWSVAQVSIASQRSAAHSIA